ncbi:hypothetical protein Prudu_016459 [Prunus dulcis]|uniref:Fatty acyl-CoA reductase n=1 Tax=Prunus dulcis TaxID=3755 RepID=A0A4Y1RLG8_PRUDU|nr:hypothetical protein Prudu_016459 [Prunus dulcis]
MGSESILKYLQNKTILVTGATGFLAMGVQPDVKKIYLLLRASDTKSARRRMHNENCIMKQLTLAFSCTYLAGNSQHLFDNLLLLSKLKIIGKELFSVLREEWGMDFDSFISEKVVALPGDISSKNFGVKDFKLREEMCNEIQIIFNSAATTKYDEIYDISLGVNTFGVLHVMSFAKKCFKLEILVHVSTAYVCGEKEGLIFEDSSCIDDFNEEKNLAEEKLKELRAQDASEEVITTTMKAFGIQRFRKHHSPLQTFKMAKLNGWANTYVFTKAMGETLLVRSNDNLPVVIIRPTIVTSTYKEPFPGWIQGLSINSYIFFPIWVVTGPLILQLVVILGKFKCILADPVSVLDLDNSTFEIFQIPVDMVVNSIIVATVANANRSACVIYHVGTSMRNPVTISDFLNVVRKYFTRNPWLNKDREPVKVRRMKIFKSTATFSMYMQIRFVLPLAGLKLVSKAFGQYFRNVYVDYNRKMTSVMRLIGLYKPFMLFMVYFW